MQVNDIVKVTLWSKAGNQVGLNIRHFLCTAMVGAGTSDGEWAVSFESQVAPLYKACLTSTAFWWGVSLNYELKSPAPVTVYAHGSRGAGAGPGNPIPCQVAGIITFRTGLQGRGARGRAYIPFLDTTFVTADPNPVAGAGYLASLDALGAFLYAPITLNGTIIPANTATLQPILFKRPPGVSLDITNWLSRSALGTQRRRGDYGRTNTPPF